MIQPLLNSLKPEPDILLSAISKHITEDMLEEIALADYGQDSELHLAALRHVRDTGKFVEPMYWYPCEVLELIRYSKPDNRAWKPGATGVHGHWMRAFASASLLRAIGSPWNYSADPAQPSYTLIQLIHSLKALPIDFTAEATRFVASFMLGSDLEGNDEQIVYFGVGLLWLLLHLSAPPSDRDLVNLAEWIVRREAELADALPGGRIDGFSGYVGTNRRLLNGLVWEPSSTKLTLAVITNSCRSG